MRSQKKTLIPLAMLALIALNGCLYSGTIRGEGEVYATTYSLDGVRLVDIGGGAEVNLYQSDRSELVVHAQENVLDHLTITISNHSLRIHPQRGINISSQSPLAYDLYVSDLDTLELSGSIDLHTDRFETESLLLKVEGSTDADLTLDIEDLTVDSAGSADIVLVGQAGRLMIDTAGSVRLNARDLKPRSVEIDSAGSAEVDVWAVETLKVESAI